MSCLPPLSLMNINLSGLTLIPDKLQLFKKKKKKKDYQCAASNMQPQAPRTKHKIFKTGA